MNLLFSPHNDDETLFASFAVQDLDPLVIIAYDSYIQDTRGNEDCTASQRREESIGAVGVLRGANSQFQDDPSYGVRFLGMRDDTIYMKAEMQMRIVKCLELELKYGRYMKQLQLSMDPSRIPWICEPFQIDLGYGDSTIVFPQHHQDGHDEHNLVFNAVVGLMWKNGPRGCGFRLYSTYSRAQGRMKMGASPAWKTAHVQRKHLALACYGSQINLPGCRPWFMGDMEEYYL